MRWIIAAVIAAIATTAGCTSGPVARAGGGVLVPAKPTSVFADERTFTLLDAELSSDQFFARTERIRGDAFAGAHAFGVDGSLDVPLGNLWPGTALPGIWQLLAWHVRPEHDGPVTLTLLRDGVPITASTVPMRAGRWQAIAVDLDAVRAAGITQSTGLLLRLEATGTADELLLVDNARDLHRGRWTVRQRGLQRHAGDVPLAGIDPVAEVNDIRARIGDQTVYRTGQRFAVGQQVRTPGSITGRNVRVVRTSPTDIDGDGFDDGRGAFVLQVGQRRATLLFEPRGQVTTPAFELSGMPAGQVLVTFAGELAAEHERLADGTVLFVLPGDFTEPTPIQVRIR